MNTATTESTPANTHSWIGGLFRTADGRNLVVPFLLITSLFLLWGFCNGMIDILNKHFQDTLRINKEQSGLVQAANYFAYFLMAIPAGLIAKKFGYKSGILLGLSFAVFLHRSDSSGDVDVVAIETKPFSSLQNTCYWWLPMWLLSW